MDVLEFEIDIFADLIHGRLAHDPGDICGAGRTPGIGPISWERS